jgi:hypothetical protein
MSTRLERTAACGASAFRPGRVDRSLQGLIGRRAVDHFISDHEEGCSGCTERAGQLDILFEFGLARRSLCGSGIDPRGGGGPSETLSGWLASGPQCVVELREAPRLRRGQ